MKLGFYRKTWLFLVLFLVATTGALAVRKVRPKIFISSTKSSASPKMNRSDFALKTIQSTFVGLIVLAVLLIVGLFTLGSIIDALYPPLPICPPDPVDYPCYTSGALFDLGQNFDKYVIGLIVLYFISICVAGFISGFSFPMVSSNFG